MNWFISPRPHRDAAVRLFCLPHAGAGASVYRHWPAGLHPDVEVLAVQLPGRESRILEDPEFDIAELADAMTVRAGDTPFAIYGHSLGARIAFEVVRLLHHDGAALPTKLYVGACPAPHIRADGQFDGLSELDDEQLVRRLAEAGSLQDAVLAEPELVQLLLPALRADFRRVDEYRFVPGPPVPVPLVAFAGRDDTAVRADEVLAWQRHAGAGFAMHTVAGDHFFVTEPGTALVELINAELLGPTEQELSQCAQDRGQDQVVG